MEKLCEALSGREADIRVLTEAEIVQKGFPKRDGVLGYVSGTFSVCDKLNKNKRFYERALWENVHGSGRFRTMLEAMTLLGEPDHPETRTQSAIREGSHTIVEQHLDTDGKVRGTVAVFDNTLGRFIWPMLKAGVKFGFSTRGDGDLLEDSRTGGSRVDPKSYEYHGVDFVLSPSFVEAMPSSITESDYKIVRTALTEAVEAKKVEPVTRNNVLAILEATHAKSAPVTESAPANLKPLERALEQLSEAKLQVSELEAKLAEQGEKLAAREKVVEQTRARSSHAVTAERERRERAEVEISRLSAKVAQLTESVQGLRVKTRKAESEKVRGLQQTLSENQSSHLDLVNRQRKLIAEHREVQAAYEKGLEVVEALRTRLAESEGKRVEAGKALESVRSELEEQKKQLPQIAEDSRIEAYKKVVCERVDVPEQLQPLMERARTQGEIDALVETIEAREASRYGYLPLRNSRSGIRELLRESTDDEERRGAGAPQETEDGRDVRKALRVQLRR